MDKHVVDCNAVGTETVPEIVGTDARGRPIIRPGTRTFRTVSYTNQPMSVPEQNARAAEAATALADKSAATTNANERAELRTLKERLLDNMLRGLSPSPADVSRYDALAQKYPV